METLAATRRKLWSTIGICVLAVDKTTAAPGIIEPMVDMASSEIMIGISLRRWLLWSCVHESYPLVRGEIGVGRRTVSGPRISHLE